MIDSHCSSSYRGKIVRAFNKSVLFLYLASKSCELFSSTKNKGSPAPGKERTSTTWLKNESEEGET